MVDEKNEFLEQAKINYPPGTKFKDAINGDLKTLKSFDDNEGLNGWFRKNHIIVWTEESSTSGSYLYYNGKWAVIISYPDNYSPNQTINNYEIF